SYADAGSISPTSLAAKAAALRISFPESRSKTSSRGDYLAPMLASLRGPEAGEEDQSTKQAAAEIPAARPPEELANPPAEIEEAELLEKEEKEMVEATSYLRDSSLGPPLMWESERVVQLQAEQEAQAEVMSQSTATASARMPRGRSEVVTAVDDWFGGLFG
ncbi:unnamed protein product, partial [Symbiodinium sp. CCMP2456]